MKILVVKLVTIFLRILFLHTFVYRKRIIINSNSPEQLEIVENDKN